MSKDSKKCTSPCTFAEVIQDENQKEKIIIQEIIKPSSPVKIPCSACSRPGKWSAQTETETWWIHRANFSSTRSEVDS